MFERLVGLQVIDEKLYQEYRKGMLPILKEYGGGFGYDFKVSDVLISESENPINRVFTIHFPDENTSKEFFSNHNYKQVREKYFNKSVTSATIISQYEK
ncbi:MAG: DUF1330 domain-containing protein [Balneola sp.]